MNLVTRVPRGSVSADFWPISHTKRATAGVPGVYRLRWATNLKRMRFPQWKRSINPGAVRKAARVLAGGGPPMPAAQAEATVRDLRVQAQRAPYLVSQITGLKDAAREAAQTEIFVVDRATWAGAAAASIEAMLTSEDHPLGTPELAVVLSAIASRVLGQFDPYSTERGRLYLVAPNVAAFRGIYDLDRRDLALWVGVHEMTHAVQFAAAPWLNEAILRRARLMLSLTEDDEARSDHLFDEVRAIMALLEGHAEYVMNRVPRQRMPGRDRIVEAMADRRSAKNPLIAYLSKQMGAADKLAQYTGGEKFVEGVVEREGMAVLNRVFDAEDNLPTPAEIKNPAAWIERITATDPHLAKA